MDVLKLRTSLKALRKSTSGAIFVEFAVIAPLLLTILLCSNELVRWMRARQHMEDYATTVANDVSTLASSLTAGTLREMIERIGLMAPELIDPSRDAWDPTATNSDYLGVGISMVMMKLTDNACHNNCAYQSNLVWTFGSVQRPCGSVDIPLGANVGGPVVIVDVKSRYKFVFDTGGRLGAEPILNTTAYQAVKYWQSTSPSISAPTVAPSSSGEWNVNFCPST